MLACLESHADNNGRALARIIFSSGPVVLRLRADEKHTFAGLLVTGINTQNSLMRGPGDSEFIRL